MKFHKFISVILHPIVIPIIGVLLYFLIIPHLVNKAQQLVILSLIFVATYIIPLLIMIFLKSFGYLKSYQAGSISERKIPLIFMIVLFYLLGKIFSQNHLITDLGRLFFATAFSLTMVYILFIMHIKTSLHILSMGNALGFFLTLSLLYSINLIPFFILFVLLTGILGSARLYLKAHTPKEIYIGFFLGIICQFSVFYLL